MTSNESMAGGDVDAIRATPEYAAALNLEVWAASRKEAFLTELEKIRQRKVAELEAEYERKDAARLKEIDQLRQELEAMALRLQQTGSLLQKKIVAFEKRESSFEGRRLEAAKNAEAQLLEAEQRNKRLVDEARVAREGLESQLREKELELQQTLQRLTLTQQEFDALQRFTGRIQAQDSEERTKKIQLQHQLAAASDHIRAQQQDAEFSRRRISELEATNSELQRACSFYKSELMSLTERFNALNDATHRQQAELILREKHEVENMSRKQIADEQNKGGVVTCADILASIATRRARDGAIQVTSQRQQRPANASTGGGAHVPLLDPSVHPISEIEELRRLVVGLVQQSKDEEKFARKALRRRRQQLRDDAKAPSKKNDSAVCSLVYAEQLAPEVLRGQMTRTVDHSHFHPAKRSSEETTPKHPGGDDEGGVELSSLSSGRDDGDGCAFVQRGQDGSTQKEAALDAEGMIAEDEVKSASSLSKEARQDDEYGGFGRLHVRDGSANSSTEYDHVKLEDWHQEQQQGRPDFFFDQEAAQVETAVRHRREQQNHHQEQQEQQEHSSNDIAHFVSILKANREKLIGTGVYSTHDPLIQEMDRKIEMYERWCRQLY